MRILLLSAYFPPEIGSASNIFYELGRELVHRGHKVTVLTGFPAYNVDENDLPIKYKKGRKLIEEISGMSVVRVRFPRMPRHIPVLRGLEQVVMAWMFTWHSIVTASNRHEIVFLYSPPLFLGLSALVLRFFKGPTVIVNIQDLFPQSAIDLGVLKNRILIFLLRKMESLIYRKSDFITVHSSGNQDYVVTCGGDQSRTIEIPNVVDTKGICPGNRMNSFRARYNIRDNEFLISFAGVLGLSQDIDTIIDSAIITSDIPNILYYIVGEGVERERLVSKANRMKNVKFIPIVSKSEYVELLQASDICLATLRKEVKTPVIPSKILSIMAAGRPVLASMSSKCDAPKLINMVKCGITVEPGEPVKFAEAIKWMYINPEECKRMGGNGREYASTHFSVEVCTALYERLFESGLKR